MPSITDSVTLKDTQTFQYKPSWTPTIITNTYDRESDLWTLYKMGNWDRPRPLPEFLKPTPYTLRTSTIRNPRLNIAGVLANGEWRRWTGTFTGLSIPNGWKAPDERLRLNNMALLDMLSNAKDQSWNAGVALAEAKGTAKLALDTGELLVETLSLLNKKRFKQAYKNFRRKAKKSLSWEQVKKDYGSSLSRSERLRKVPNSWTYYHFGIKPTIQDIEDIQNDWFRRNKPGDVATANRFAGQVRGKARFPVKNEGLLTGFEIFDRVYVRHTDIQSVRVTCGVRMKNEFLSKLSRMGVTNVPEAVWNGIPFSWAVDYFSSFGDWLSALDSNVGWEYFDLCESYRRVITTKASYFESSSNNNPSVPRGAANVYRPYTARSKELVRTVPSLLYPPVYRTRPMWDLKGPSGHQFSMLTSVLAGLLHGGVSDVVRY